MSDRSLHYVPATEGRMAGPASRRPGPQQRLTSGFLATLPRRVQEVAAFLSDESIDDPTEAAVFALGRMASTADSLGLDALAAEATRAAAQMRRKPGIQALVPLVRVMRQAVELGPFAPIGFVGSPKQTASIEAQDDRSCEPLRTFTDIDSLRASLAVDWPQAIVLPALLGSEALGVVGAFDCPVYLFGPARDWAGRQLAARVGAAGYLAEPLSIPELLAQVRYRGGRTRKHPSVAVFGQKAWAEGAAATLEAAGIRPLVHHEIESLAGVLHSSYPDAVVFGPWPMPEVKEAILALRQHIGRSHVAVIAVGEGDALYEAGADDVVAPNQSVVTRLRTRLSRFGDLRRDRDDLTRVPNRAGTLESLQGLVAWSIRTNEVLSVGLIHAAGLSEAARIQGREAGNACRRHLAAALERGVRRFDLIGYLGAEVFLAAQPSCRSVDASRRMADIKEIFEQRIHADRRLREVRLDVGFADTTLGTEGLMLRAEAALNVVRAS